MDASNIRHRALLFEQELPHTHEEFAKRNWGSKFHSICSYQGKLKPALAHWLIRSFSEEGDIILDPLGGVGTVAFEAQLLKRTGVTSDLNPLAAIVARAKVCPPKRDEALRSIDYLQNISSNVTLGDADFESARFGLNARVLDYYHPDTLTEILKLRRIFCSNTSYDNAECFVRACMLHILHGNRPYALSRTSHPITPFSPKGEFQYKSVFERLRNRVDSLLSNELNESRSSGFAFYSDFRDLASYPFPRPNIIITSPPFPGMRFDRPNWLRLWFCGWEQEDFLQTSKRYLERQQVKNYDVYTEFFCVCDQLIQNPGLLIMHIGGSKSYDMIGAMIHNARPYFDHLATIVEDVEAHEKHGIKDKGLTTSHNILIFSH